MNPVPIRELARVQSWRKHLRDATSTYAKLWLHPVDSRVLAALRANAATDPELARLLRGAEQERHRNSAPFAATEFLQQAAADASPRVRARLRAALAAESPAFRIQKSAWLESGAKNHAWNRHFVRARRGLQKLTAHEPGNQEAWFDLAQAQAARGLALETMESYRALLRLDPQHQLARLALDREEMLGHPAISTDYLLLDEQGADRASSILRQRVRLGIEAPIRRQILVRLFSNVWFERPDDMSAPYTAQGPQVEVSAILNELLSLSGSFVYKHYNQRGVPDTFGGSAAIAFNVWDYASLTAGYERADVIHNRFGILQGTQADSLQLGATSFLNHWTELNALATYRRYTDDNDAFEGRADAGILLLDHPTTLELTIGGEFRTTRSQSLPVYQDGQETDLIHPYWTPQNYFRGFASLEWRHDLSRFFFAHAEQHYYLARLRGSYDTDSNPSVGVDLGWHLDFARHWTLELTGSVERSPQWNGASAWSSLLYRF